MSRQQDAQDWLLVDLGHAWEAVGKVQGPALGAPAPQGWSDADWLQARIDAFGARMQAFRGVMVHKGEPQDGPPAPPGAFDGLL